MAAVAAKPGPDMELRRAFVELQSKMVDAKQKMKMADVRSAPSRIKCSSLASAGNADDLYLLMMVNPDVPSMAKPLQR